VNWAASGSAPATSAFSNCAALGHWSGRSSLRYFAVARQLSHAPNKWKFSPAAERGFNKLRREYSSYTQRQKEELDRLDWWTVLKNIGFDDNDLRLRDLMDSTDFGESIRHVSGYAAASEYFESSPYNEMDYQMRGGNSRLVGAFASRVGSDNIHLQMPVRAVTQKRGRVYVRAGEGGEHLFQADACVCTAPVSALRQIRFDPALPSRQARALEELIYARIIKNPVLFGERFWKKEDFSLVSDRTSHYYFHTTKGQPGREGILVSYATGDKADVLAAQNHRERRAMIAEDLASVDKRAPQLARGMATYAWQRDRWTKGAYALYRPGQWFGLRPILQRPHGDVLFAGEHLADWQGFMEGAINTGEDAAAMLLGK
jgi:monoamine oxidase